MNSFSKFGVLIIDCQMKKEGFMVLQEMIEAVNFVILPNLGMSTTIFECDYFNAERKQYTSKLYQET